MAEESKAGTNSLDVFRTEWFEFWQSIPNKAAFFTIFAAWIALFHFLGSSTLGYVNTPSLFAWLRYVYNGSPDDEHGMLIPIGVLLLFWWKRKQLMIVPKQIWWPALSVIVLTLAVHIMGYSVQVPQLSVAAFFAGLYGIMGLIWGWRWLRESFFPMILFVFCVPLGSLSDGLTLPLRLVATDITAFFCNHILGIHLIQQGTQLFDPTGKFQYEVAAACGGLRSLIALLALTTLYAFMNFKTNWRKALMIASAVPLAMGGNVFRLVSIIVAAEAFGQNAGNFVHDELSLLPYIPAIAGILLLGYWLREYDPAQESAKGLDTR